MSSLLLFLAVLLASSGLDRPGDAAGHGDARSMVRVLPLYRVSGPLPEDLPFCHRRMLRWPIRAKLEHQVRQQGSATGVVTPLANPMTELARRPVNHAPAWHVWPATNDLIYELQKLTI